MTSACLVLSVVDEGPGAGSGGGVGGRCLGAVKIGGMMGEGASHHWERNTSSHSRLNRDEYAVAESSLAPLGANDESTWPRCRTVALAAQDQVTRRPPRHDLRHLERHLCVFRIRYDTARDYVLTCAQKLT